MFGPTRGPASKALPEENLLRGAHVGAAATDGRSIAVNDWVAESFRSPDRTGRFPLMRPNVGYGSTMVGIGALEVLTLLVVVAAVGGFLYGIIRLANRDRRR